MGVPHCFHPERKRPDDFRSAQRGGPEGLVHDGHEHRGVEIFSRQAGHAGARIERAPTHRPCGGHDRPVGSGGRVLPHGRRCRNFPPGTSAPFGTPEGCFQFTRLVQLRLVAQVSAQLGRERLVLGRGHRQRQEGDRGLPTPAVLRLFHQLRSRQPPQHPGTRQDRRDALQVGFGHGYEPLATPLLPGIAVGRRCGLGSPLVHERI